MAYSDIVVQLDVAASSHRYQIAAQLAARADGHVAGVYLKTSLINQYSNIGSIGYLPPVDLDLMIREHNQAQDDNAAKASAALAAAAMAAGVACEWRTVSGDAPTDLVAEARRADLVVLPPPASAPAFSVDASAVDITLGAGGPVLVVPETGAPAQIGHRVLLAWNGSREAARALRDALPLMADGAVVEVRMARPKDAGDQEPEALRRHLERHGLAVNLVSVVDEGQSIAGWLRAEAARTGCDLMVMGLYGHARLQEFVLGGVSRDMIHAPSIPLLLSH